MEIEHIIGQANIPRAVQSIVDFTAASENLNDQGSSSLQAQQAGRRATRYVSAAGGCLLVNSIANPHEQVFLQASDGPLSCLRVSRSGNFIVSGHCGRNADVTVWNAQTLQLVMTFHEHERAVVDCDITDDDTIMVSLGAEKRLCFVDISNGALVAHIPLNAHVPDFQGPTAAPNCSYATQVLAGPRVQDAKRRQVNVFHTAVITQQSIALLHLDPYRGSVNFSVEPARMRTQLSSFLKTFTAGQFSAFGDLLFLGTESGEIALMNTENGAILQTIRACTLGVRSLCVVSSGDMGVPPPSSAVDSSAPLGSKNEFRYANYGAGSLRSSVIYVGGGDGSITTIALHSHQQVNQLSITCRTSVVEPISTITIIGGASYSNISTNSGAAAAAAAPPPKVLVQALSGTVFAVDIVDTQLITPEHDMYNKRQTNGAMDTYGGRTGDVGMLTAQQQRSSQLKNTHSMSMNRTLPANHNEGLSQLSGSEGGGGFGTNSTNVKKVSDACRSPSTAVVVHPIDPSRFYSASADGTLREWDLNEYTCRGVFEYNTISHGVLGKGSSANPTFNNNQNPSGRGFAQSAGAGGYGALATRHQNAIGGAAGAPAAAGGHTIGANSGVQCTVLKIAEALDLLLSGWSDGCVQCHDLTDRKLLWVHCQAHRCPITSLCATSNLKYFVTGGADGEIRTWDTKTREMRGSTPAHQQAVIHLEFFSPASANPSSAPSSSYSVVPPPAASHQQEQYLLSASRDRTICTWELGIGYSSFRRVTSHQTHSGPLTACKLGGGGGGLIEGTGTSAKNSYFYSAGVDRKIHICDLRNPREPLRVFDYNSVPVAFSSQSSDERSGYELRELADRLRYSTDSHATCFAFGAGEHLMVTGGSDAVVKMWGLSSSPSQSGTPLAMAAGHSQPVSAIAFTCDQKQIVSCSGDGTIAIWNNYF